MRGLKQGYEAKYTALRRVALFVSAWIETLLLYAAEPNHQVALFVSAWIETEIMYILLLESLVALFVSAWIETILILPFCSSVQSHSS